MNSLPYIGRGLSTQPDNPAPILGIEVGVVVEITRGRNPDNSGAKQLGFVKVRLKKFETTEEKFITGWAPVATFMGGSERGAVFLPEKGDEVLVAFESGNINQPYVIGSLHSDDDKMPVESNKEMNDVRIIKSKSGLTIKFTDTKGEETLEIMDEKDGASTNKLTLDLSRKKIMVESSGDIELEAKGELQLKGKSVLIESSSADVDVKSAAKLKLDAGSELKAVSGAATKIDATGMLQAKSKASVDVDAGAKLGLKGGQITLG